MLSDLVESSPSISPFESFLWRANRQASFQKKTTLLLWSPLCWYSISLDKKGTKSDNRIFQPMLYRVRVKGDVGKGHINPRHLTELA